MKREYAPVFDILKGLPADIYSLTVNLFS